MDTSNTIISACALTVSIIALFYTRRSIKLETTKRNRELITQVLLANTKLKNCYEIMRRERNKTGKEILDHEKELFSEIEMIIATQAKCSAHLESLLRQEFPKISDNFYANLLLANTYSNDISNWIEFRIDRFIRHNDNRVKNIISVLTAMIGPS